MINNNNKNALQWDAYRPLVDRIPACTVAGGKVTAQGGVPAQGVYLPGGCTCLGSTCLGVPAQVLLPPVDKQSPMKTLPSQTSFACGKNFKQG